MVVLMRRTDACQYVQVENLANRTDISDEEKARRKRKLEEEIASPPGPLQGGEGGGNVLYFPSGLKEEVRFEGGGIASPPAPLQGGEGEVMFYISFRL